MTKPMLPDLWSEKLLKETYMAQQFSDRLLRIYDIDVSIFYDPTRASLLSMYEVNGTRYTQTAATDRREALLESTAAHIAELLDSDTARMVRLALLAQTLGIE